MSDQPQPTPDAEAVEQTRRQIRALMQQISVLSKQELPPDKFYAEFLNRVVAAMAAPAGAIWAISAESTVDLVYQINIQKTGLPRNQEAQRKHGLLLAQVLKSGQGLVVPQQSGGAGENEPGNPTDYIVVLAPLRDHEGVVGAVEVFHEQGIPPGTQQGYLRFLLQACDMAAEFHKGRSLRDYQNRQELWGQLESFTRAVHNGLDPRQTCFVIANEGRRLIACDRVSVGVVKGKKVKIEAISGQDVFDSRANTVRLLANLAAVVVRSGEPLWFSGDAANLPPQIEGAVQAYVDESQTKMVAVLPLHPPFDEDDPKDRPQPIGALIVEQIEDTRPREGIQSRVDVVREHGGMALANSLEHTGLFLLPLWRMLGQNSIINRTRRLPKKWIALGIIAFIAFLLWIIPADFTLEGRGTLEPIDRRDVFFVGAEHGVISRVNTKHLQEVTPLPEELRDFDSPIPPRDASEDERQRYKDDKERYDQLKADFDKVKDTAMLQVRSPELTAQLLSLFGQRDSTEEDLTAVEAQLNSSLSLTPTERMQLAGRRLELRATMSSLQEQIRLHEKRQRQLYVFTPIEGKVTTMDVDRALLNRPVERGHKLLTVANLEGDWDLEIMMPEDRLGHITEAQQEFGDDLKVEFILATDPGVTYEGKIKEIQRRAEVRGEEGNTVLIKVQINKQDIEHLLRPGATVIAKVHCGTRSVGYVWFHDLWEFLQTRVFFRL